MPLFVAYDSAEVWAHRELFKLDERGRPTVVTGVPPDYFSETGQLWGNPHHAWKTLEAGGFAWFVARLR
jgi:4-alpha-glucanotransferase